jgi:hypothetical protein
MLSIESDILDSLNRQLLTGNTESDSESVQKFLIEIMAQPLSELGISNFTIEILPFNLCLAQASYGNGKLQVDTVIDLIQFAAKHEIRSLSFDIESNSVFLYSENLKDWCILMGDMTHRPTFQSLLDGLWYQFFEYN